jgi:hypothetical protein
MLDLSLEQYTEPNDTENFKLYLRLLDWHIKFDTSNLNKNIFG